MSRLGALALLACAACPPSPGPVPPPNPDASDAAPAPPVLDDCQKGCAALAAVSCAIGDAGADCAGFLRGLNGGKEPNAATHRPLMCSDVAAVRTKDDARRLGFGCP